MSRKFIVWLNSGANAHSCRKVETTLDELGLTSEDWDKLTEGERDEVMKDVAFEQSDWGYSEID